MSIAIKICGITTPADALQAADLGATHLGLNFYAGSPRAVNFFQAQAISRAVRLRQNPPVLVGVFVNEDPSVMQAALDYAYLDLAQLSGDEPPEVFDALAGRAYRAYRLAPGEALTPTQVRPAPPALLLDANLKGQYGGTGHTTDWSTAAVLARHYPLFLAGGLTPANVADAITAVQPWGVDVASGVESAPGVKDPEKLAAFIAAVQRISPPAPPPQKTRNGTGD